MSLTNCIKELGAALDARDKKAVLDGALQQRKTTPDADTAAIAAAEAHLGVVQQQLHTSEQLDAAVPPPPGAAPFEAAGLKAESEHSYQFRGSDDQGAQRYVSALLHQGQWRVSLYGPGLKEKTERTFPDAERDKAEAFAASLVSRLRPLESDGKAKNEFDKAKEQLAELAGEFNIPRELLLGRPLDSFAYKPDGRDGVEIKLSITMDPGTSTPQFFSVRSGKGWKYESISLPTQESARALLRRWLGELKGVKQPTLAEDKERMLAQFPVGTHVRITKYERLGADNGKWVGRTGEVVDGHFDGWYVKLDPSIRERTEKRVLFLSTDGMEQVDKATIKPARTKAEIEAERRETERTLFADLVKDKLASPLSAIEHLAAEIRRRAGDVALSDEQVQKLAEGIRKKAAADLQEAAKAEHRNPVVLSNAIAGYVASTYPNAETVTTEQHQAFMAGFQHAMAGKTKSTLTGEQMADRQKGYAAAVAWRNTTEEGAAWFEGRPVNKLKNTGVDLRRHWEQLREQMKATESDVKKAWRQIERATTRADLFAPIISKPGATPGYVAYATEVRDGTRPFKSWLQEKHMSWYGSATWGRRHRKDGDPTELDYILDGSRYPDFRRPWTEEEKKTNTSARYAADTQDDERIHRWKNDEAFRAEWLRGAADVYLAEVRALIAFLENSTNVKAAADAFTDLVVAPTAMLKVKENIAKGNSWTPGRYDLTPDGSRFLHQYWSGKDRNFLALAASTPWTKDLISKETSIEAIDKTKPLTPPRLDRVTREGQPDTRKGRDVTPAEFKDTFGFADVGFGQWVGAKQDQDHLNYAYDAFMDLARHFGTDPKNIGLGGVMHFTIGALGHGKFAAHFWASQPHPEGGTTQVINVTNTKGDGTVYHEWTHALDHNLAGDWRRSVRPLLLSILRGGNPTARQVEQEAEKFLFGGWHWSNDKHLTKPQAAKRAMQWLTRMRMGNTAYNANAMQMGKNYWGNDEEMIARASEAWALDTLEGKNTYLVNPDWAGDGAVTKEKGYRGTPYPSGSERKLFAQVYRALAKSITWADGKPSVKLETFKANLGPEFFAWEKRRDELDSLEALTDYMNRVNQAKLDAVAEKEAETDRLAAEKARELEELEADAPLLDTPNVSDASGPLSDTDLEDLFDQAAAELREETQEQPGIEPPPDASTTPPEIEPTAEVRTTARETYEAERETAKRIGQLVRDGHQVVFSGTEWASMNGLPRIQDFPSDKVRHIGFGVFQFSSPEWSGSWTAGGAMEHGGPEGTSYTTVSIEKGEWANYPRQKVLDALEAFINRKPAAAKPAATPAPDKGAAQLLAEAAKLGVTGANEALTGLAKLFGSGPGRLNSFPGGFDEETYQKAKPHFKAALEAFQAAGRTLKDLFKMLIAQYGDGIKEYAVRFAKDEGLTNALGKATAEAEISPSMTMARTIAARLKNGDGLDWRMLFDLADNAFGGKQAEGKYTPKDAYDALELGVNLYLQTDNGRAFDPSVDAVTAAATVAGLERVMALLPTQTKRTTEQQDMQQFSTVPPLAYAAAWVANLSPTDTTMEPSAGVGGLAVFAKNAGSKLVLNELSSRRGALLQELFPAAKVWTENAEQIDNILPANVVPSVVLMNPPFSNSSATNIKRDTTIGARHVEQALQRLAPGGRLVAVVGEGMARHKPAFKDWWAKIDGKYNVRAAVPIDGSGYAKYGTTFDNVLLVIDKVSDIAWPLPVVTTPIQKYSDLIPLLQEVRNGRREATVPTNERESVERDSAERAREDAIPASERDAGAGAGADGTPAVGRGEAPGAGGRGRDRGGRGGARDSGSGGSVRAPGDGGSAGSDDAGGGRADAGAAAPAVSATEEQKHTEAITASVFEIYRPQRTRVEGAKEHPGALVQSSAMATVLPPTPTYTPNLPVKAITAGAVSDAQMEAVIYAGQAHQEILPSGDRKGFFIGDGTGVGKGREIGAIILDNWRQGRKKHVWVSEKQGLIKDAKRDYLGVLGDEDLIFNQNKTEAEGAIDAKNGILFTTYSTLRSGANSQALNPKPLTDKQLAEVFPVDRAKATITFGTAGRTMDLEVLEYEVSRKDQLWVRYDGRRLRVPTERVKSINGNEGWRTAQPAGKKKAGQSRLDQLTKWLGEDFDGVLVFDEAHNAGNATPMKGTRGFTDPSLQALSVVELQKRLPKARVVYVSATGATTVANLSFATRLGLWGPGTPFASVLEFINEMTAGGLATMELVARDMKQMGVYLARSLSYQGVTYSRVEHELTPAQRAIYDRLAQAWQVVLQNFNEALELTKADKSAMAKSAAKSAFWSGQQRFFNQVITSMQMPSVLEDAERELDAGHALVMQLVNTNEAAQERSLAKRKDEDAGDEPEELDLTPRDQLLQMVEKSFPVNEYEEYRDEDGKKQVRQVLDAQGNPVQNKEAVAMRDRLLKDLQQISVPEGPLEQLINHFGPDVVAEVTGRGRRVLAKRWNKKNPTQQLIEPRGAAANGADADAFMADKKRILVFSDAGGTGYSFHADRTKKNQRQRTHYLLQPGWRADKAVQGFGRTHRTNEASEPHYKLASTNIPAHKRFLSAIARRLDQLGALTKGQRDTANQGLFSEKDNLEGIYAQQAVRQFLDDVRGGRGNGLEFNKLLTQMGLESIVDPQTSMIAESKYPETRQFLNRMLSLELEVQEQVFEHFIRVMEEKVEVAIQRGEFDAGMQTIRALSAHALRDEVVFTDPKSGAETRYVELELTQPTYIRPFPESTRRPYKYLRNESSGKVWAWASTSKITKKDGSIVEEAELVGTGSYQSKPLNELRGFKEIGKDEAHKLWAAENEKRPKTYTERAHLIVGAMLPIWDRLKSESGWGRVKVVRTQTDDGRRYLGRLIDADDLKAVLKRLNVGSAASKMTPAQAMAAILKGDTAELANGWKISRVRVSDDVRLELHLTGLTVALQRELTGMGVLAEQISWKERLFIPTGKAGVPVLEKLLQHRPLVDLVAPKKEKGDDEVVFARRPGRAGAFDDARRTMIQQAVDQLTAGWKNRPPVHVIATMDDAPAAALDEMGRQDAQDAAGETAGFLFDGEIYLVANQLGDREEIATVLHHEALGHFGLRGVWGDGLVPILQQLATMRPQLVAKKAKEYGLDLSKEEDRLTAAEEVLAEMAQTKPELGWVQRTIALIRRALRAIGWVKSLSDTDIIASYILPARGFVERGRAAAPGGGTRFSRGLTTREVQVDGKWRPIVDARGRLLARGDFQGQQSFWRWFKESQVVDEAGRPQPVFHGTDSDFSSFDDEQIGESTGILDFGSGFYFTTDPAEANDFATHEKVRKGAVREGANIMVAYLSLQNPATNEILDTEEARNVMDDGYFTDLRDWLQQRGYDGIAYTHKGGRVEYVAFKPEQVKSAIGNDGGFDPTNPDVRFARTSTIGATRKYTPAQERAMKDVGFTVQQPTLAERASALWKDAGKRLAQGIADQFAPIKEISKEAYSLLRLSKGASGAFETLLHGGMLKLSAQVYDFDETQKGGVIKRLLIPLQGEHHDFFRWVAANRAERLKGEGKERLFTDQDIADLKTLADGQLPFDYTMQHGPAKGQKTRERRLAYADSLVTFNAFNKNVMDMAEQSGLIDGASRHLWEHEFYVPFYRVSEDFDGGFRGANIKTGVVRQKAFEALKGGKEKLNADLLDNTLLNWAHLLDAAAKNRAAKATLEAAQAMGIAIEAKADVARQIGRATGNRNGVVWFADQGLERYFVVDDPYVLTALTSLEYAGMRNPVMDAMGAFKHALTVGVTASPFFKIRNLIRDSVTVLGTSSIDPNPFKNLAQGWKDTDPKSEMYYRLLAGGGTIHFGTMLEGSEAKRVQALVESGVDQATILDSADKVKAFYRKWIEPGVTAYNELGNRGEAVNRAALYDQLRKQGMSHADASLQARDLMDFSLQGSFTSIRFLTQVVPFFNARLQGLYKLGRAAKEDPARFAAVVGATAGISVALLAAYGGDDDWKRREEWDRDNYWWFKFGGTAFRIPKPFEIGAMATLAERGFELAFDKEMTGPRFRRVVLNLMGNQLSMNPIPQLIKPVVDVYANFDSFTERPIETMDMERLRPEYRFTERTSMIARGTSTALNGVAGLIGGHSLSPVQVDHLLRGYFGWLGAFIVGAGDTVLRPATDQPRQAAPDYWKSLTGGMVAELEGAPSRYVSQMYEQAKEIEQAYGTWKMLQKQGKGEEAAEFRQDNQALLAQHRGIERIKRHEGDLNRQIREIERSDMDPVVKRERIQAVRDQQDRLARSLSPGR